MKKLVSFMVVHWQTLVAYLIAVVIAVGLFTFSLSSLVPHFSQPETLSRVSASSLYSLQHNPIHLPYKLIILGLFKLHKTSVFALRAVSAGLGLLFVLIFYRILKNWYTTRIALLGTLLFATSSWLLHIARLATPDILLASSLLLVWCGWLLRARVHQRYIFVLTIWVALLLLYIPGFVWFVLAAAIWQYRNIITRVRQLPWWLVSIVLLASVSIVLPLVMGIIRQPSLLKPFFGLPDHLVSIKQYGLNLVNIPVQLYVRSQVNPVLWLGNVPLLDIFSGVMFLLGLYSAYYGRRLDRNRLLFGLLVGGCFVAAFGGSFTLSFIMPVIYLLAAGGLALMLRQWFTVFPRNPLAGAVGASILTAAVLLVCYYNFNHYFIAWPNAPETRAVFNQSP